ncbi:hypothetical protein H5410_014407, partial [Solanum commersonii]
PKLEIVEILVFGLTLVNIWGTDARIKISRILLDSEDDFRPSPELILAFLGVVLISCGSNGCWVNETSDLYFNSSIESRTSSLAFAKVETRVFSGIHFCEPLVGLIFVQVVVGGGSVGMERSIRFLARLLCLLGFLLGIVLLVLTPCFYTCIGFEPESVWFPSSYFDSKACQGFER